MPSYVQFVANKMDQTSNGMSGLVTLFRVMQTRVHILQRIARNFKGIIRMSSTM